MVDNSRDSRDNRGTRSNPNPVTDKKTLDSVSTVNALIAGVTAKIQEAVQAGEWGSHSFNVTYGPGEAPVLVQFSLAGTTKENAIKIQNAFLAKATELNNAE